MIELLVPSRELSGINAAELYRKAADENQFTPYERDMLVKLVMGSPDLIGTVSTEGTLPTSALSDFHCDIIFLRWSLTKEFGIIYDDGVSLFRRVPDDQVRLSQYHVSTSPESRHGKYFGESTWQLLQAERTLSGYVDRNYKEENGVLRRTVNLAHPEDAVFVLYAALGNIFDRTIQRIKTVKGE
jgi:hypothetical protein